MDTIVSAIKTLIISIAFALGLISPPAPKPPTQIIPLNISTSSIITADPIAAPASTTQHIVDKSRVTIPEVQKTDTESPKRITGGPLPLGYKPSDAKLDVQKIFLLTNIERLRAGKQPLSLNKKLSLIAEKKTKDMIAQQYFAHISPNGKNINDLANEEGYEYSLVGENLAMGDFTTEQDIVDGWMNSKGHRENILKTNYTEIGVSVILGKGEGREMWYAVQEFGRPKPSCTKPSDEKSNLIATQESELKTLENDLKTLSYNLSRATGRDEYDRTVTVYNTKTDVHNTLLAKTKVLISEYNESIAIYNSCIEKENAILEQK